MDETVKECHRIKKVMIQGCNEAYKNRNRQELEKWIKELKKHKSLLSKKLKPGIPINQANAISDVISLFMRFEIVLGKLKNDLSTHEGAGISNRVLRPRSGRPTVDVASSDRLLSDRVQWRDLESAFRSRIRTGVVINLVHKDLNKFFDDAKQMFLPRIRNAFNNYENLRVNAVLSCNFIKQGEDIEDIKHFNVRNFIVLPSSDINQSFDDNIRFPMITEIEEFETEKSGWSLTEILNLNLNFNRFTPLAGGYSTFVELPKFIQDKKAVLNIRNKNDDRCFLWSVVAALFPAAANKNPCRVGSYPKPETVLKFDGIDFPFKLQDIHKF